uniref:Secreted protein n=1 Tax=Arundo donax TaxID=35708 RepID=A0A0A9HE05_ARUDO
MLATIFMRVVTMILLSCFPFCKGASSFLHLSTFSDMLLSLSSQTSSRMSKNLLPATAETSNFCNLSKFTIPS